MTRTPGLIIPSSYPSKEKLEEDLRRRDKEAGFTPFEQVVTHSSEAVEDILEHHGVRGMKWGVRNKSSHVSTEAKRTQAILDKSKNNTTKVKSLTNHELTQLNKRLEMEKKFKDMTKKQNSIDKGHAHVKKLLAIGATANTAYAFSKTPTGKALKDHLLGKGKHFKS